MKLDLIKAELPSQNTVLPGLLALAGEATSESRASFSETLERVDRPAQQETRAEQSRRRDSAAEQSEPRLPQKPSESYSDGSAEGARERRESSNGRSAEESRPDRTGLDSDNETDTDTDSTASPSTKSKPIETVSSDDVVDDPSLLAIDLPVNAASVATDDEFIDLQEGAADDELLDSNLTLEIDDKPALVSVAAQPQLAAASIESVADLSGLKNEQALAKSSATPAELLGSAINPELTRRLQSTEQLSQIADGADSDQSPQQILAKTVLAPKADMLSPAVVKASSGDVALPKDIALLSSAVASALAAETETKVAPSVRKISLSPLPDGRFLSQGFNSYQQAQAHMQRLQAGSIPADMSFTKPGWNEAVGNRVLMMAAQNLSSAEIQLDPPELGPLQVRLAVSHEHASVTFVSQNAQVRDALDQSSQRLREMFEEQGLNLVDVDVSDQQLSQGDDQASSTPTGGIGAETDSESDSDDAVHTVAIAPPLNLVDHYA